MLYKRENWAIEIDMQNLSQARRLKKCIGAYMRARDAPMIINVEVGG